MYQQTMLEQIKAYASSINATLSENKEIYTIKLVVAERKAFLSTKKLEYIAKFRIVEASKEFKFTEMLKESGSGLTSGGYDTGMSSGFGFKTTSYKVGLGAREESIEEQSNLFGKSYSYKFDFKTVRSALEKLAGDNGFIFKYQIIPIGL